MKGLNLNVLSFQDMKDIDNASKTMLENAGIYINHQEALDLFKQAGAEVDYKTKIVKIPRGLLEELLAYVPKNFVWHSRDGSKDVKMNGDGSKVNYAPLGFATGITDYLGDGKFKTRPTTLQDITNLGKIEDCCSNIDVNNQGVSALDVLPTGKCPHVREWYAMATGGVKPFLWDSQWRYMQETYDAMVACYGGDEEEARKKPFYMTLSCTTSPLQLDFGLAEMGLFSVRHDIPYLVMTMGMSGTSAPMCMASTIAENNAENLAGIALLQLAKKGAQCVYGSCTTAFDFYTNGAPFGSPEATLISCGMGQMANFYGIPGNICGGAVDSKIPDQQCAHEKTLTLMMTTLTNCSCICGPGIINLGMSQSLEQFVIDNEIIDMIKKTCEGIVVSDETLMEKVVERIGSTGDYIAEETTLNNMDARSCPKFFDRHMEDEWRSMGSRDLIDLAHARVQEILSTYQATPIDADAQKKIEEIIKQSDVKKAQVDAAMKQ